MKTNFLYFKQRGSQSFTATDNQTAFTLADDGSGSFDQDFSDASNNEAHVEVTVDGAVIAAGARTFATNVMTITAGVALGKTVTVTSVPRESTEVAFRADRFLGVRSTSNTVTTINFKAGDDAAFNTTNDIVTLTHTATTVASDAAKLIAVAVEEAINATTASGVVDVLDRASNTGTLTTKGLTFSNIQLSIEA
tara:strand:+ start:714 stop:1295 length:582 start_codon:yes stop_codon:yes gene_type:complete